MKPEHLEKIEDKLSDLTHTLHDQLLRTGLMTNLQWNDEIAPKLSDLSMAIENVTMTARTYKVHHSFTEE